MYAVQDTEGRGYTSIQEETERDGQIYIQREGDRQRERDRQTMRPTFPVPFPDRYPFFVTFYDMSIVIIVNSHVTFNTLSFCKE